MKRNYGSIYTLPLALWGSAFFIVPIAIILFYSFMEKALHGGVVYEFSLEAYEAIFNPVFAKVAFTTLWISVLATVITILIALPCAYYMARSRRKNLMLFLIIIPFWTNFLIRIYAWIAILGNSGSLNNLIIGIGLRHDYIQFLYTQYTVVLVLVYSYLPYAILPLYSTIEKFDFGLLEAARDLGASHFQALRKVLLPNIRAGIVSAVLFTFIPTFGAYAVPQLVGGKDSYMLGNIIARELTVTRNWPLASSISVLITLVTAVAMGIYLIIQRKQEALALQESGGKEQDAKT